jgi:hypothetical protein
MAGLGWTGVIWLVLYMPPTVGPRWLFFLCWFLALSGSALPVTAYLHIRFPGKAPATQNVILRQSMWVGFYGAALAWLQIGRVVTPAVAAMLAIGLVAVEWLLRLRERGQWRG